MRVDELLTRNHVPFERLTHPTAYTAGSVAQALHVPGREMAKTVLLRTTRGYALAVLPATHRVDLDCLQRDLGETQQVEMASEDEMDQLFPDCERGAMTPFGSLYKIPTVVDEELTRDDSIVFEAQCHDEAIRMKYRDYESMEHPRIGHFACRR
jgi:Ala-tRNA(Pro) deacylase